MQSRNPFFFLGLWAAPQVDSSRIRVAGCSVGARAGALFLLPSRVRSLASGTIRSYRGER